MICRVASSMLRFPLDANPESGTQGGTPCSRLGRKNNIPRGVHDLTPKPYKNVRNDRHRHASFMTSPQNPIKKPSGRRVGVETMSRSAGGSMMRAVGRAVGAGANGAKEALSATAAGGARRPARRVVTVTSAASSSPSSPTFSASSATGAGRGSIPCFCDGEEWEAVGVPDEELEGGFGIPDRFVFGQAPSKEEAQEAISTLKQIFVPVTFSQVVEGEYPSDKYAVDKVMIPVDTMHRVSSTDSESDWIEPALHLYSTHTFQSQERERVLDAFRLLQVNPSIQRMVISLSSDKAVWDAVMNNEVVQELKKSFYEAENSKPESSEGQPDIATRILRSILDNTMAKIVGFFDMITKLVNDLFHSQEKDKNKDFFDVALRSSFMLSAIVFMIVVVTRIRKN